MSLDGIHRMLTLAETAPSTNVSSLVAAHEYGMLAKRLANVSESLLIERGIDAFPLAGYVMSLTGGITSLCAEARQHGYIDKEWTHTIRQHIKKLHRITASHSMLSLNKKVIQNQLYDLFQIQQSQLFFTLTVHSDTKHTCAAIST